MKLTPRFCCQYPSELTQTSLRDTKIHLLDDAVIFHLDTHVTRPENSLPTTQNARDVNLVNTEQLKCDNRCADGFLKSFVVVRMY